MLRSGRELSLVVGASQHALVAAAQARAFLATLDVDDYDYVPEVPSMHYDATSDPGVILDWVERHVPTPPFPRGYLDDDETFADVQRHQRDQLLEASAEYARSAAEIDRHLD